MSYKWEITVFWYLSYAGLVCAFWIDHVTVFIILYDFCGCLGYLGYYNQIKHSEKGDNAQFSLKIQINSMTSWVD